MCDCAGADAPMDGWTAGHVLAALVLLSAAPLPSASSQASIHVALGARYSTPLVQDSIVSPIAVRPALGPLVLVTGALPLERGWTAEAVVHAGWAALHRDEAGAPATALGTVRTIGAEVSLRRRLTAWGLAGRMGIGALKYFAERTGIFRDGAPPPSPLWSAGLRYDPPTAHGFAVEARYDLHGLITPALRGVGFTSPRVVHRAALLVSLRVAGVAP